MLFITHIHEKINLEECAFKYGSGIFLKAEVSSESNGGGGYFKKTRYRRRYYYRFINYKFSWLKY